MATTPLPISQGSMSDTWDQLIGYLGNAKAYSVQIQAQITGNGINPGMLLNLCTASSGAVAFVQNVEANTTLAAAMVPYIQQQLGNSSFPVAATVSAIVTALQGIISAIYGSFPTDTAGNISYQQLSSAGALTSSTFTASQFPSLNTAINTFLATLA